MKTRTDNGPISQSLSCLPTALARLTGVISSGPNVSVRETIA